MMTWQPHMASCRVISLPMPDDAPVMTAVVPCADQQKARLAVGQGAR